MREIDKLSMLDDMGLRKRIIPAEVKGRLRRWRVKVHFVLMLVFLLVPWIKFNGSPLIKLDIFNRRFEIFGQIFLSHDSPLIFFGLISFALLLMLVTALWGRVWCGWACPQTVFIDAVFLRIERFVEGGYLERRRLHQSPWNFTKIRMFILKWGLYFLVSSIFSHSFIAYFSGSESLLLMMKKNPTENWTYFLLVTSVTLLVAFNFGWFREQFCIIMCPYGRFQSLLTDSQSLMVTYDENRGEPRKGSPGRDLKKGDCISCNRCVEVCPTGIDIRNGVGQLECIGCTACIDACNEIMDRVKKPQGLIRHSKALSIETKIESKTSLLRPRIVAYLSLILVCVSGLIYNLHARRPYAITLMRAKDTPYQVSNDGKILNHFKVHALNQSRNPQQFQFELTGKFKTHAALTYSQVATYLAPGESKELHLFLSFEKNLLNSEGLANADIDVLELISKTPQSLQFKVIGPYSKGSSESSDTNP